MRLVAKSRFDPAVAICISKREGQVPEQYARLRRHSDASSVQLSTISIRNSTGKAAHYALALWRGLTCFLNHPALELSSNLAEYPCAPSRLAENWIHIGSAQAGPKIAAILSVVGRPAAESRSRYGILACRD